MMNTCLEEQLKGKEEEKLYHSLFYGMKESVLKCTNIEYESAQKETFNLLHVPLPESSTLEDALKNLFSAEELSGDNAYNHETYGK